MDSDLFDRSLQNRRQSERSRRAEKSLGTQKLKELMAQLEPHRSAMRRAGVTAKWGWYSFDRHHPVLVIEGFSMTNTVEWRGGHYWVKAYDPREQESELETFETAQALIGALAEGAAHGKLIHIGGWQPPDFRLQRPNASLPLPVVGALLVAGIFVFFNLRHLGPYLPDWPLWAWVIAFFATATLAPRLISAVDDLAFRFGRSFDN